MSDQPLTLAVLAQFHRQVILPDIERVVGGAERRLHDEMHGLQDFILSRLDRLETEYQAIKEGLRRLEARHDRLEPQILDLQAQVLELRTRLGRVEERLEELIAVEERFPVRAEVQDLQARIERLQEDIRRLEQRIKP